MDKLKNDCCIFHFTCVFKRYFNKADLVANTTDYMDCHCGNLVSVLNLRDDGIVMLREARTTLAALETQIQTRAIESQIRELRYIIEVLRVLDP